MTEAELKTEYRYRVEERLGMITDGRSEPTLGQVEMACAEAHAAINLLREQAELIL